MNSYKPSNKLIIFCFTSLLLLANDSYAVDIGILQEQCAEIGFKMKTPANGKCVLRLMKSVANRQAKRANQQGAYANQAVPKTPAISSTTSPFNMECQTDKDCTDEFSCRSKIGGGTECRATQSTVNVTQRPPENLMKPSEDVNLTKQKDIGQHDILKSNKSKFQPTRSSTKSIKPIDNNPNRESTTASSETEWKTVEHEHQTSLLNLLYPDWEELASSDDFATWRKTLPIDEQEALQTSWDAMELAKYFTQFKNWKNSQLASEFKTKSAGISAPNVNNDTSANSIINDVSVNILKTVTFDMLIKAIFCYGIFKLLTIGLNRHAITSAHIQARLAGGIVAVWQFLDIA